MKWYYTRSEEENNLKSSGNEKWGLIKNSLQIYNSLFDTSGNGECLSIFHYWFLLFIIFLHMIEPLTWSEYQTLAKPSTFPLRNHYLLLSGGKKNHRSMCLICILQKIHKSILTKRTFAFLSLIKCDCFVQNWSECTPSLSCGKRALLSAIKRGNWNPMGYCQTGFQYLSILFA